MIYTIAHQHRPGLITVFTTLIGMIYVVEFVVLVLFGSYVYKPEILSVPYYDNVLGSAVTNLTTVPIAALVIAAFRLDWKWIVGVSLTFGGIEWLFSALGVYQLGWWKIPYTLVLFAGFFVFARWWLQTLKHGHHPLMHFISLLLSGFTLLATSLFVTAMLTLHLDHAGVFRDPYRDSIFISSIYGFVESTVLAAVQFFRHERFLWNLLVPTVCVTLDYGLWRIQVIHIAIHPLWYFVIVAACSSTAVLVLFFLNRWLLQLMQQRTLRVTSYGRT